MERGVQAEVVERKDRDKSGKFVKGNKITSPRTGRPRKMDSMPILRAITEEYSLEELGKMLRETYKTAYAADDAKAMLQVIKLVLDYAIGKPVVRTLSATIDPDEVRNILGGFGRDDDDEDDDTIEIDG